MRPETIISIVALLILILIFIIVPKIVEANERRDQYSWTLLRRARRQWERAMNKALEDVEKKLK